MGKSFDTAWFYTIQNNVQDMLLQRAYEMYRESLDP